MGADGGAGAGPAPVPLRARKPMGAEGGGGGGASAGSAAGGGGGRRAGVLGLPGCTQGRIDGATGHSLGSQACTRAKEEKGPWGRKRGVSFLCCF